MRVEKDTTLLVEGRASVRIEGKAEVFGYPVESFVVGEGKILPVYISEDSEVEVDGNYIAVKGSTIPKSWDNLVEFIEREGFRRIVLFGDTDSGKSSLATYLANKLEGRKWIVDLDIGQSDVAHPCAMGIGFTEGGIISISEVQMVDGCFVGTISPTGREARCLKGVAKVFEKVNDLAKEKDRIIVDTTGWTKGKRARDYKLAKIEIISPDLIVCFERTPYYLRRHNTFEVESFVLKKRSREVRSSIRSNLYAKWLENAEIRRFDAETIENSTLFKGEAVEFLEGVLDAKVLFSERGYDFLNVCVEKEVEVGGELIKALLEVYDVKDICIFSPKQLEGLMVGLYNGHGRYLGFGLLKGLNFEDKTIEVLTSVKEDVKIVEFGEIKLNEELKEEIVRVP